MKLFNAISPRGRIFETVLLLLSFCAGLAVLPVFGAASRPAESSPPVYVILWFDTEDYLLPADDDACKRLAEMLTERHIRATFKVVGEKARVLERRGRTDVIRALKKHVIAYHANFHSVHPTPTEYLAHCGLLDGIDEFVRREGGGAADVRRIFGVPTLACYGQPGSSWAPQALGALKAIGVAPHGVPCYVDEGEHVGLDEKPFWYMGVLNVYHMGQNWTRMDLHDPSAVEPAKEKVAAIAQRLRGENGGLISIFYHPCEWVHQKFWDGVNFSRGANPPREQWRPPPQRSKEETEAAFDRFGRYIDFIRSLDGVQFITAADLPELYPDVLRSKGAAESDLNEMAAGLEHAEADGITFQVINGRAFSAADQFEVLTRAVGQLLEGGRLRFPVTSEGLLGPDSAAFAGELKEVNWLAFRDTTRDVLSFINTEHRVPARVFVGAQAVAPSDYLGALASVYRFYVREHRLPSDEQIALPHLELASSRYVAKDSPNLFGGWIIHKEGFEAPELMALARLQAWTLKPAVRKDH